MRTSNLGHLSNEDFAGTDYGDLDLGADRHLDDLVAKEVHLFDGGTQRYPQGRAITDFGMYLSHHKHAF